MKTLLRATLFLMIGLQIAKAQSFNANLAAKLQATLDTMVTSFPNTIGMSASVYYPGQGTWTGVSGISYSGHPITPDMEFGIASNSKLFTAVVLLKLAEDHILSLDDSIHKWIPVYNNIDPKITIRQLLNHTSGVSDPFFTINLMDSIKKYPTRIYTENEVLAYVGPKVFNPGGGYNYSNTNYILAGMVAKSATGIHISRLIRDSLLTPLQLNTIFYDIQEPVIGTLAHRWANFVDYNDTSRISLNTSGGAAGSLFSTSADLVKWYNALMNGSVINANSFAQLTTFLAPGNYGLGLGKFTFFGKTCWGHGGSTLGYTSRMVYDPCMKAAVFGVSNSDMGAVDGNTVMLYKVLIDNLPTCAGLISGTSTVCQGQNAVTYTVPVITNATSYIWTLPTGATGSSASNSITINFGLSAISGKIIVKGTSAYGDGAPSTFNVNVNALPLAPGSISGTATVCKGQNQVYYTVLPISNATSYVWTLPPGATGTSSTNSIIINFGISALSGNITVKGKNSCGNGAASTFAVTVNSLPIAAIMPATVTLCSGSSAYLTASGGGIYSWSNNLGANATVVVTPSATTIYTVTVTSSNSCSASASRTVTVNQRPVADAGPDIQICSGVQEVIGGSPTASGGSGVYTYLWSPVSGLNNSTSANPTASPSSSRIYTVTVTDGNGCSSADSRSVSVTSQAAAAISPSNTSICSGSGTYLTATGGGTYSWSHGLGSNAIVQVNPSATTIYTVTVSFGNSCTAMASATVTVNPNPVANAGPDVQICSGSHEIIGGSPTATGGNGIYTYLWSPVIGLNNPTIANPTASPSSSTIYTVLVRDGNACSATDSRTVSITSLTSAAVSPANTSICSGTGTLLTASGGGTYTWSNGLGSNAVVQVNPSVTTIYSVTVSNGSFCSATASATVIVNANPVANAGPDNQICAGSQTIIGGSPTASGGNGIYTYLWSPASGLSNYTAANPSVNPSATTIYTVIVRDGNGCSGSDSRTVTVNALPIAAISPPSATICTGASILLTATGGGIYAWSNSLGSNQQVSVSPQVNTAYTVTVTNSSNCSATANALITLGGTGTLPPRPTEIIGSIFVCPGTYVYSTPAVPGASSYLWVAPAHSSILSGQGTSTINLKYDSLYYSDFVMVYASNCAGNSTYPFYIQTKKVPPVPLSISGPVAGVCPGSTNVVYSTPVISGVSGYTWNASGGASIVSGQGTNSVLINFTSSYTSANISVRSFTPCSYSVYKTIVVTAPPAVSAITGTVSGLCSGATGLQYSVTAISGASYSWAAPLGTTITAGQGTNLITMNIAPGYLQGNLYAQVTTGCGTTTRYVTLRAVPAVPGVITGYSPVCPGISLTYTIQPVATATFYTWTVPSGWAIDSGQGTTRIFVRSGNLGGNISVVAGNNCGNSIAVQTKSIGINLGCRVASPATVAEEDADITDERSMKLYPNPATDQLYIESNGIAIDEINIYNISGQLVTQIKQPGQNRIDINLLANGVYISEIRTKEMSVKRRWVKM